ncbi:MAG: undecaprenyl/decaprenyl-phosphate alpha-N-acetylglucosaminyl 1-phosphate transferase [Anaerolineales bacterium]|nr:undecaprenyl/decaprenyl-phosphate alpha-N-acetylglucosaminyl 1-phosphate transferase [Anaerolineales bacterium]
MASICGPIRRSLIAISFDIIVERVTLPIRGYTVFPLWITYPLTVFWIMGMINTVNWLDGLDGLAAGVAAIASLLFAIHAYSLGQTVVALFPLALAAACLGFLPFNFHPARIFYGQQRQHAAWLCPGLALHFSPGQSRYGLAGIGHSHSGCGLVDRSTLAAARQSDQSRARPFALPPARPGFQPAPDCVALL